MKAAGLKPVTIWVPDVNAPGYREEIRRQCKSLQDDPQEAQILAEIEQWADTEGWHRLKTTTPKPVGTPFVYVRRIAPMGNTLP